MQERIFSATVRSCIHTACLVILLAGITLLASLSFTGDPDPEVASASVPDYDGTRPTSTAEQVGPPIAPSGCRSWSVVDAPGVGSYGTYIRGISAVAANDVWSVGFYRNPETDVNQPETSPQVIYETLTEHWDGNRWSIVPSPNVAGRSSRLTSVSALASNDIWAVGRDYINGQYQILIEHWDGTQWNIISSPNAGGLDNFLLSVSARTSSDVWASGYYTILIQGYERFRTLIMHWNGTQWNVVPSPNIEGISAYNSLSDIVALAPDDALAVGWYSNGAYSQTLIQHWNGTAWSIAQSPTITGAYASSLSGVSALAPNNIWAVGSQCVVANCTPNSYRTLVIHWDGIQWSVVPSPNIDLNNNYLGDVVAISPNDVWAIGNYMANDTAPTRTLAEHWDGTQWSIVTTPNISSSDNTLYEITATAPNDVWTAGEYIGNPSPLILHYSDTCLTPSPTGTSTVIPSPTNTTPPTNTPVPVVTNTPVPVMTNTPVPVETNTPVPVPSGSPTSTSVPQATNTSVPVPTNTPVPVATNTSVPLPTTCTTQFLDVPSTNTFYAFVRCLACRGIISGYSDGTFRPNNEVKRGQLAKIVTNAAGWAEPVTGQTFSDVPPGSTFYEYIERAAAHGAIRGYSDGTFRPNNNATRGQISKVVSNAAGFNEPVTGQTFSDVPPGSTFYEYIERMASRGVIGGYSDGTFRPNNNATRGQTAKIVSNAFFPGCQTP